MNIIITGANGFIGKELIKFFEKENNILAISQKRLINKNLSLTLDELIDKENFSKLKDFNPTHLIHTAAIAHVRMNNSAVFIKRARYINEKIPLKLYILANKLGLKRFIFLSSIGVHGFRTKKNKFFSELSRYKSYDKYTEFKRNAERSLINSSRNLKTELIIFRPAVVYGRNAPGNFNKLVNLVDYKIPFIVSKQDNLRSILYVKNLVSAISKALNHPIKSPQAFVLADEERISTKEIIRIISKARNKKIILFSLPVFIFDFLKRFPFLRRKLSQLVDSLVIDSSLFHETMNWKQPYAQKISLKKSFSKNNLD